MSLRDHFPRLVSANASVKSAASAEINRQVQEFLATGGRIAVVAGFSDVVPKPAEAKRVAMPKAPARRVPKVAPFWTPERDQVLRDNYSSMTTNQLAALLGTGRTQIYDRIDVLELRREVRRVDRRSKWTDDRVELLCLHYPNRDIPLKKLADQLETTVACIVAKAGRLGLSGRRACP